MAEIWLKPDPYASDIAWVSFDLQEHKTHNNAALVMDHSKKVYCGTPYLAIAHLET